VLLSEYQGGYIMTREIKYDMATDGLGFNAQCDGRVIGEITFVRVGSDKFIIDHTAVAEPFRGAKIGLNLVRHVCELARRQNRKIFALCPFARAMFNRYSEFDDVRLMRVR